MRSSHLIFPTAKLGLGCLKSCYFDEPELSRRPFATWTESVLVYELQVAVTDGFMPKPRNRHGKTA
jgi:hypothetical protein